MERNGGNERERDREKTSKRHREREAGVFLSLLPSIQYQEWQSSLTSNHSSDE